FSRRVLMTALISYGESAVPLLIGKLSDPSDAVRGLAAGILGEIPNSQALPALIKSIEDPSPEVRARAAYALGRIGQPLAVKSLIAALSDPFWYVRLQAARSLGRLASPRAIYDLWLRLTDPHAQVRLAAAESLVLIGPPALQALTSQLLYTADRYAREQVSEVLQQSGLIDRWIEDLDVTDETVVQQVQELLVAAARGGALVSMVNALQGHPRSQVRMKLLDLLGRAGMPSALRVIHRVALHDSDPLIRERAREVMLSARAKNRVRAINGLGNHR
ncbi:MAG: HEAT repeat domain-containing protein, partial [Nitrospiria bacterium]